MNHEKRNGLFIEALRKAACRASDNGATPFFKAAPPSANA
jgi:hypothetical protein